MIPHISVRRLLLILLALAQLMVIIDISAVNVALPSLSRDLGIAPANIQWTITAYSLLFGSLLLFGGRAADLLGRRRTFLAGLGLFTSASLAAALAPTVPVFYGARVAQGIGAALLSPAALSTITTTFTSGRERATALGVWGAVGGAGAAVGVLLGGVLTEWVSWRGIFFINVPVGLVVVLGVLRMVPIDAGALRWRQLDLLGATVATLSLGTLLEAFAGVSDAGWVSSRTLVLSALALVGLVGFIAVERRAPHPMLRVERLTDRMVASGFAFMLVTSSVLFSFFLLTSVSLQEVLGASPLQTGIGFLPIAIAAAVSAHAASHLIQRFGARSLMAVALTLAGIGSLLLTGIEPGSSYLGDVLPGMLVAGFGLGLALVAATVSVLTGATHDDAGMFSGLTSTGHEIGGALGIAVLSAVAAQSLDSSAVPRRAMIAAGVGDAYMVAAVIATIGAVLAIVVFPSARQFLHRLNLSNAPISLH
jgi:EmrB/QacA subfamily drug resistance transporter